jgi:hypothetical protein
LYKLFSASLVECEALDDRRRSQGRFWAIIADDVDRRGPMAKVFAIDIEDGYYEWWHE